GSAGVSRRCAATEEGDPPGHGVGHRGRAGAYLPDGTHVPTGAARGLYCHRAAGVSAVDSGHDSSGLAGGVYPLRSWLTAGISSPVTLKATKERLTNPF